VERDKLTDIEKKYLDSAGGHCIFCGSKELDKGSPFFDEETNKVYVSVMCLSCAEEWSDIFSLTEVNPVTKLIEYKTKEVEEDGEN